MKNNKRKLIILALLLFAAIGFSGFGAYSYYWTQGNFDTKEGTIRTDKSFDPEGIYEINYDSNGNPSYNYQYLGSGGVVDFSCTNDANGYLTCTGLSPVYNNGNTTVSVTYQNFSVTSSSGDIDVSSVTPTYKWVYGDNQESTSSSISLDSGESATLVTTFSLPVYVGIPSEAEEVNAPVTGVNSDLTMSIDLYSEQTSDYYGY